MPANYEKMMKGNPFAKAPQPPPKAPAPQGQENAPSASPEPQVADSSAPTYPKDHVPARRVPKGGAMCANCKFSRMGANGAGLCSEPNFVKWNGTKELPADPKEYASDWWQPRPMPEPK